MGDKINAVIRNDSAAVYKILPALFFTVATFSFEVFIETFMLCASGLFLLCLDTPYNFE